jgi:hypothetical protein
MNRNIEPGLALDLPLDKRDGNTSMSGDAFGHAVTVTGALWQPGGYWFDGADDRITVANHPAFSPGSGDFSLEIWIKAEAGGPEMQRLLSRQAGAWFFLRLQSGLANFSINDGAVQRTVTGGTDLRDSLWHHLLAQADRDSSAGLKIFLDGIEHAAANAAGVGPITSSVDLNIGRYDGGAEYFRGNIGDVRIYNRLLDFPEIRRRFLATKWRYR